MRDPRNLAVWRNWRNWRPNMSSEDTPKPKATNRIGSQAMDSFINLGDLEIGSRRCADGKGGHQLSPIHISYRAYQALQ